MLMKSSSLLAVVCVTLALVGCKGAPAKAPHADSGPLTFEAELANTYVPADAETHIAARLAIGTRTQLTPQKTAINLALVVDTSGSMRGAPIERAREASQAMIDALSEGDRLSVVAFHSDVEVLLPSTEIDDDEREEIKARIAKMEAKGTTNMADGLRKGLDEVRRDLDKQAINRIVLLGDGVPNDREPQIRELAAEAGRSGITITSLGLGLDYNESLMGAIAQNSGGRFRYIERADKVAAFFQQEVLRLNEVYGKNARIELRAGPGVFITRVVGKLEQANQPTANVAIGDLSRDDERELIVELRATGRRTGASVELLDAVLVYEDARHEGQVIKQRLYLGAEATTSQDKLEAGRNADIELALATVTSAADTVRAIEMARAGDRAGAEQTLKDAAARLEKQPNFDNDSGLRDQRDSIKSVEDNLDGVQPSAPSPQPTPMSSGAPASRPKTAPNRPAVLQAHELAMDKL